MTAFAIDLRRDRITITTDSLVYLPDRTEVRPLGFGSKVLALPHLKAALWSRGQMQITANVFAQLLLLPQLRSIEAVAEALPEMLRNVADMYCDQYGIPDRTSLLMLDLTLGGWSEARGCMQVWQFDSTNDYAPITNGDAPYGLHAHPPLPREFYPTLAPGATVRAQCVAVLEALGRSFDADPDYGSMRIGGDVIETEITPAGISQRTIARLPGYEEDTHAGAAVYARMERGEIDPAETVRNGLHGNASAPANDRAAPMNRQQRRAAERQARARERQHA